MMIYKNGFREYFLMVVLFGVPMGALIGLMKMSVAVGLIAGVFSGAVFMLLMLLFVKVQEKNYAKMRAELSKQRKIICDGAATIQGTGGWMFFTEQGLEFYPHRFNTSTEEMFIPTDMITDVKTRKNQLVVTTENGLTFAIVVARVKEWKKQIDTALTAGK